MMILDMENELNSNCNPPKSQQTNLASSQCSTPVNSEELIGNCPQKRKRGRPRKSIEVTNASQADNKKDEFNSNYTNFSQKQTTCSRSGRALKVPTRYASYQIGDTDSTEDDVISDDNQMYECDACGKTFISRSRTYVHQYNCSIEKDISCDLCQEKLKSYKDLWTHQKTHQSYSCDFCKQVFRNVVEFRIHSRWHTLQTLECSICHRRFLRGKAMKEHMVQVHDQPMELYTCLVCQKTFALLDYLKEHQKTHEGEDGFTMEYIVKPIVKDTAKQHTCNQDKSGKTRKELPKKTIQPVKVRNKGKINRCIPPMVSLSKEIMESPREFEKRVRREIKENKNLTVYVHIEQDNEEGQKIVTSCQNEPLKLANTQQNLQQLDSTGDAVYSIPKQCVVALSEVEEAANELVRQSGDIPANGMTPAELEERQQEQEQHQENDKETTKNCNSENLVQTSKENQVANQVLHQFVGENIVNIEHSEQNPSSQIFEIHHGDQIISKHSSEEIVQENHQIYLCDGQTIVVEQENLEPGQQIYLHTYSENGHIEGQQIIMQGNGPTVFVQEGPDGQQQHVVVQSSEDCIAIDDTSGEHHVIVQDGGGVIGNNQEVIMQSEDISGGQHHDIIVPSTEDYVAINGRDKQNVVMRETCNVTGIDNNQQLIMQSEEGSYAQDQHIVLQTTEDCITIDGSGHQDVGNIAGNNIMQTDDGTAVLLGDCSVGDSIIVAAMQNV